MTITTLDARDEYTASAGQTVFNYTFKIFESTDLNVYVTPSGQVANDSTDLTTSYTVTGEGDENGGTITLTTPASAGDLITIVSNIPSSRTTDYQSNGDFIPQTVNDDFDRVVSITKKIEDTVNRTVVLPQSQQGPKPLSLPNPVAGKLMRWNGGETGLENVDLGDVSSDTVTLQDTAKAYDTIAQALADTGPFVVLGAKFTCADYATGNGAGTLTFKWVATGTGTPDGGSYLDHDTLSLQAEQIFLTAINVKQWGVKGDDTTNDTTAFNNAISYCQNNNRNTLYVPDGIYLLDSLTITGRSFSLVGYSMGTIGLNVGTILKCRAAVTDFITIESAVGIIVQNFLIDGNNFATNTVRLSNNQTETQIDTCTIVGCVNGGVNLNLEPKTINTQVSELIFRKVLCAGRAGGSGITNMLCDSNQFLVNSFYDCKWFGNSDGDVSKNIEIKQGQITCYTPFFTGLTTGNDLVVTGGAVTMVDGRSESSPVDSISVTGGTGDITLINYVHGSTIGNTTYTHTSGYTGHLNIIGGQYTNITLSSASAKVTLSNPRLYSGGLLGGTNASDALIFGGLDRTNRESYEVSQATLTNLKGISIADGDAKNLTGSFTLSDTSTTAVVTFPTAEPDALYRMFFSAESIVGLPANNAFIVERQVKTAASNTVHFRAAPGAGTSINYAWFLVRYG